jgi:hypothetical protein
LAALKASNDFEALEEHWERFLSEANRVSAKLKQAFNKGPQKDWWDKHAEVMKTDPLLRYVKEARNAAEHSLQEIASEHKGSARQVTPTPEETQAAHQAAQKVGMPYALLGLIEVILPHAKVIEITKREGTFQPPKSHLGNPITDITPAAIGDLALAYFELMMKEAEQFQEM